MQPFDLEPHAARQHSVPPNVSWPMVWYRFVKELPQLCMIVGAVAVCIVFVMRNPEKFVEGMLGLSASGAIAGLIRSKPAEDR